MRAFLGRWQVAFALLGTIWGCSFWWIKLGLEFLTPVEVAFARMLIATVTLLVVIAVMRVPLPRKASTWKHLAVVALLMNSIPFTLFAFAETHVSSVLAGIINATTPLTTLVVILLAFPEEHPTRQRVVGLLIGFVGVLVVLGVWRGMEDGTLVGVLALIAAVICYGIGLPYTRRYVSSSGDGPISLAAGQVVLAAAFLLPAVVVNAMQQPARGTATTGAVIGVLALGALGSGVAYILNYRIIAAAGASTSSAVTYVTPIVAVIVGVGFLGEHITWYEPVGALIVLFGIAYSQGRFTRRTAPTPAGVRPT